jgi:hypothetical protein
VPDQHLEKDNADSKTDIDKPRPDDHLEDEEKILAGRVDVNMPALLTKDVQGG